VIRFNWKKILEATKGKENEILLIVHSLTYNLTPKNYRDPLYKYFGKDWSGFSFLVNPEAVFINRPQFSDREWVEYVAVASYRNLNAYYDSRKTTIDLLHLPVSEDAINNNRLLKIEDNKVHFRFEEVT
jgi:hypothetical protein